MKVKDLIKALQYMGPETEVHFSYNSGDYWATQVAPTVESVSLETVQYSGYINMTRIVNEDEMHEDEGDYNMPVHRVVVIR